MSRTFGFGLFLLSILFARAAVGLGLGEATVQSALNQPLKAKIELVNVDGLAAEEILPGLATREEFARVGVERVFFLSEIKFDVRQEGSGEPYVELTSKAPVREPFLNFIVEVIWPAGRMLREYAILIDPPVFVGEDDTSKVEPARTQVSQPAPEVVPAPLVRSAVSVPSPVQSSTSYVSSSEYGPTTRTDTLWDIALKARPSRSVTPQQVMLAIQDLNPRAFMNGNINRLKTGQVLRLPDLAQIEERSRAQAIQEVVSQNEALKAPERKRTVSASPDLSGEQSTQATAKAVAQDKLKLVVANEGDVTDAKSSSGNTRNAGAGDVVGDERLALAMEQLDKSQSENSELTARLSDLEEQLETLQRLLTLKNDQLANIQAQNQLQELNEAEQAEAIDGAQSEAGSIDVEAADDLAETAESDVSDTSTEQSSDELVADAGEAASSMEEVATEGTSELADTVENEASEVAQSDTVEGSAESENEVTAADLKPPVVAPVAPAKERTFATTIEEILANPLYLGGIVAVLLLLLVILWLVSRSNARKEEQFYARDNEQDQFDEPEFEEPQTAFVEETSFEEVEEYEQELEEAFDEDDLSEFETALGDDEQLDDDLETEAPEPVNEHPTETRNAIEEAEAYIVYGRYDQALTVLASGIQEEPLRADYRLRMLELYCELEDTENFDIHYSELQALQNPEANAQADVIKAKLSEAVFAKGNEAASAAESETAPEDSFEFETVEEVSDELDVDLTDEDLDVDLDIDLDLDSSSSENDAASKSTFNVDFSDVDLDADLDGEKEIDLVSSFDTTTNEEAAPVEESFDAELIDEALEESLSGESSSANEEDQEQVESLADSANEDTDEGEAGFNSDDLLNEAEEEDAAPAAPSEDAMGAIDDFDFLNGTDEASTKLDLARAYIDMGDTDGARDILLEVEKEGSPEQQEEARNLIDSL